MLALCTSTSVQSNNQMSPPRSTIKSPTCYQHRPTGTKAATISPAPEIFNNSTGAHLILEIAANARPALIKAPLTELAAKYHPIRFLDPHQTHEILVRQSAALPLHVACYGAAQRAQIM
ncbi:hypothetical protein DOTSEDRAFT_31313 [Dothistroma septosporum NZE10]|uniref:Uncharacterized protein n=1 Tax=Dothistroma septosporum (strain NZE10 / CBS 128990) TaxID=675120 RepID=N1Q3H0_DOTSN|nr:hypothetical protein DOTSEDRAFT_31313 [Dothistroma septosporum NZE10]